MKKFFSSFKSFAMKGNVIDMAVGVIIGGAFGKIVTSLVNDIIMPLVGLLLGNMSFTDFSVELRAAELNEAGEVIVPANVMKYGVFIQNIVDFLIIALSIFIFVRIITKARERQEEYLAKKAEAEKTASEPIPEPVVEEPKPTATELLLTEIRDLLKKNDK